MTHTDACGQKCINPEEVKKTLEAMPSPETILGLSEIFKALADASRIKIVTALLDREHCVCDLAVICGQSESAVSHQLRVLRTLRIVKNRRQGKIVYYSLDDDHVRLLLQMSIEHISH
ncbi:MAG: metalloregulator ArsR/SmtB family transcription factor [Desulfobacterales bacterium]|nr:metalloregulator ArsR/SmtB family transcription factor [Desulfobacterales bacterium]